MKLPMETVACALDLPVSTLARWIRQGSIPIQQSGTDVVFSQTALQKWVATHNLTFTLNNDQQEVPSAEPLDSLVAAMKRGKVIHGLTGADTAAALTSAVACIDFFSAQMQAELLEKLLERERLASTGIGNGIAIPHPRDPLSCPPGAPVIITCFPNVPVDFNAIDDRPVFVFFILISPTVKLHLHLLSRLSYCIRDRSFVSFLKTHPDAQALCSHIAEFEKQLDDQ